ncbi:solute carrier family 25 protein [archaeon]|nr:MAG: solute carrier family 25 protein [archaeon]
MYLPTIMTQTKPDRDQESTFVKAGIAGFVCAIVAGGLNGFDVTKIRLQNQSATQQQAYQGMIQGMMKIYREEGIRGLGKGIEPSMLREITYSSVRIGGYEPIRRTLSSFSSIDDPINTSPLIKFASAILSGGIGSALMSPLDLIKTRFQATLGHQNPPYKHTFHAIHSIIHTEGLAGLYKGWVVTCSRAAVLNAAQLGSYDSIKHNLLMSYFGMSDGPVLHLVAAMSAGILTTTAANPCEFMLCMCLGCY